MLNKSEILRKLIREIETEILSQELLKTMEVLGKENCLARIVYVKNNVS